MDTGAVDRVDDGPDPSWFTDPDYGLALVRLFSQTTRNGALPLDVKLLMVSIEASVVGASSIASWAAQEARRAGLSDAARVEAELTGALSRGLVALTSPARFLRFAAGCEPADVPEPGEAPTVADMVAFLVAQNPAGAAPVREFAAAAPVALSGYFWARKTLLADGALPRKIKELLLVGVNATERFADGVDVHLRAAQSVGATRAEAVETVSTSMVTGGIPAWQCGSRAIISVFGERS